MDAVEFLYEKNRMMLNDVEAYKQIKNICSNEGIVEYVKNWSKEHPRKTRLDDFKDKYPNARLDNDTECPDLCCITLGYCEEHCYDGLYLDCKKCWNQPIE